MKKISNCLKKILDWALDILFRLIDYWLKEIPYFCKELIVLFIIGIISLIWKTENWYDIYFGYFFLHWIYSSVRISAMKENNEDMSDYIGRLTRRNEALEQYAIQLEKELETTRSQNKES